MICCEAPEAIAEWHTESNNVVCVAVESEEELMELASRAVSAEVPTWLFTEPDLDDQATAIAFAPCASAGKLCSHLPLALRRVSV